ncbi:albusnodin/ikarugamycin family macrolactam cyclase [Streptomyces sp. NPDC017958]|uniref:albusnodin/ikarugamycin family macrolactam cyclase n=1 Tax=Streptomyces sp. NPDC017958 TaxID=3365021 RepID=UPI0037BC4FB8
MPVPPCTDRQPVRDGRHQVRLPRGPALAGVLPPGPALPAPAAQVWPGEPVLWSWGSWHDGEVRTVECPQARVLAVGQCLADTERMRHDLVRSARDGHWERLTRWPGAYLLLVLEDGGRLTAYTDLAGQFPLYYARCDGRTIVSTLATAVAAMAGRDGAVDTTALAAHIFCPSVPELAEGQSAFAGVRRLQPGEALRIDSSGAVTHGPYERLEADSGARFEESAARLRASLQRAVALRAHGAGRISCDFSGGMDSTALAFLAVEEAAEPLDAFVYHHPDAPAGDLEHAVRYAHQSPGIRLHVTRGGDASLPYRSLESRGAADQPDPSTAAVARLRLRLAHIAQQGAGTHLTGEGGDALLTAPPVHLGEVAASGERRRLAHDALALGRLRRVSPASIAWRALRLARTPLDRMLRELAVQLENPQPHPPQWLDAIAWWPSPGPEASWLTPRTRRDLAELAAERAAQIRRDGARPSPGTRAALCDLRASAMMQSQLVAVGRPYGVWTQAPFLDGDVVRACMTLPAPRKADPFIAKPLLAAGLAGLVPEAVLHRRTKGDYAAEDYLGARFSAPALRARLTGSPLADLGIVEPARVIASLDRAVTGLAAPFPAFNRLLGVDVWLRTHAGGEETR